jgi:TPR repeat protein
MKHLIIIIITLSIYNLHAQPSSIPPLGGGGGNVDSAQIYLAGLYKKYNPQKAFYLYKQRADTGEAKAMNAIALLYTKGIGVDSSISNAMYWYTKAIQAGYTKAIINAGMLQKHIAKDSVGYAKAVAYFQQATQLQDASAYFALGYMYFKGLGCTQSYSAAIDLFKQGIQNRRADCMYFLGLCYKNGYGLQANTDSANKYIDLAAKNGYAQANNYFASNATNGQQRMANNSNNILGSQSIANQEDRSHIKEINYSYIPKTKALVTLLGSYEGLFTQYDYSGKQIKVQMPLKVELYQLPNKVVTGYFYFNGSTKPIEIKAIQQGNQLMFSQSVIHVSNNKSSKTKSQLVLKTASLQQIVKGDTAYLNGTIQLYNNYTNETDKPVSIALKTKNIQGFTPHSFVEEGLGLRLYPNPTKSEVNLQFTLQYETAIKVNVYSLKGVLVYTKIYNSLPKGNNTISFNPFNVGFTNGKMIEAGAGIYSIQIQGKGIFQTLTFIKE